MSALPLPMPTPERRSFRAETLEEALQLVSEELGPDAIVVRQREGVIGGVGGFFGRRCVELEVEIPTAPRPAAPKRSHAPGARLGADARWVAPQARAVPAGLVVDLYDTGSPARAAAREPEERYGWPMPASAEQPFVPLIPESVQAGPARTGRRADDRRARAPQPPEPELEPAPVRPAALVEVAPARARRGRRAAVVAPEPEIDRRGCRSSTPPRSRPAARVSSARSRPSSSSTSPRTRAS